MQSFGSGAFFVRCQASGNVVPGHFCVFVHDRCTCKMGVVEIGNRSDPKQELSRCIYIYNIYNYIYMKSCIHI